MKIMDLTNIY